MSSARLGAFDDDLSTTSRGKQHMAELFSMPLGVVICERHAIECDERSSIQTPPPSLHIDPEEAFTMRQNCFSSGAMAIFGRTTAIDRKTPDLFTGCRRNYMVQAAQLSLGALMKGHSAQVQRIEGLESSLHIPNLAKVPIYPVDHDCARHPHRGPADNSLHEDVCDTSSNPGG